MNKKIWLNEKLLTIVAIVCAILFVAVAIIEPLYMDFDYYYGISVGTLVLYVLGAALAILAVVMHRKKNDACAKTLVTFSTTLLLVNAMCFSFGLVLHDYTSFIFDNGAFGYILAISAFGTGAIAIGIFVNHILNTVLKDNSKTVFANKINLAVMIVFAIATIVSSCFLYVGDILPFVDYIISYVIFPAAAALIVLFEAHFAGHKETVATEPKKVETKKEEPKAPAKKVETKKAVKPATKKTETKKAPAKKVTKPASKPASKKTPAKRK